MPSKQTGLGDNAFVSGYDISGDVAAVDNISGGPALLEMTAIDKYAVERFGGLRTGALSFSTWFNDATSQEHDALKGLPTADVHLMYCRGTVRGNQAACIVAKQVGYDWTRGADGSLQGKVEAQANAYGLEWCRLLTAGKDTAASGTVNGASVDDGSQAAAVNITSSSVANPTVVLTAAAHLLASGDGILIAGHSGSTPDINGVWTATVLTATTFTIPVNVTVGGTGGTMTRITTRFGLSIYLQGFSIGSGSADVSLQESQDDGVTDAFATITGGQTSFGPAQNPPPAAVRLQTSLTQVVERYLRYRVSGTYTNLVFAVAYQRHLTATAF